MKKVVYNACFGGFSVSEVAAYRLVELGMTDLLQDIEDRKDPKMSFCKNSYSLHGVKRHDPRLVQVIEELGDKANGRCAKLKIQKIYGNQYKIDDYDGNETVVTPDSINNDWEIIELYDNK
jgi:hypothetical protein